MSDSDFPSHPSLTRRSTICISDDDDDDMAAAAATEQDQVDAEMPPADPARNNHLAPDDDMPAAIPVIPRKASASKRPRATSGKNATKKAAQVEESDSSSDAPAPKKARSKAITKAAASNTMITVTQLVYQLERSKLTNARIALETANKEAENIEANIRLEQAKVATVEAETLAKKSVIEAEQIAYAEKQKLALELQEAKSHTLLLQQKQRTDENTNLQRPSGFAQFGSTSLNRQPSPTRPPSFASFNRQPSPTRPSSFGSFHRQPSPTRPSSFARPATAFGTSTSNSVFGSSAPTMTYDLDPRFSKPYNPHNTAPSQRQRMFEQQKRMEEQQGH
ncbi:hypothetical protein C8R46DRAFT_1343324 [Mycena filopes]|nr:hypothetical protein C8R46DRAFT_1343324 [Mycena filopes]